MKSKEELSTIKEEASALNVDDLEQFAGGMSNPVAGLTLEQARKRAAELDALKQDVSFSTMTGAQFMEWWAKTNNQQLAPEDLI